MRRRNGQRAFCSGRPPFFCEKTLTSKRRRLPSKPSLDTLKVALQVPTNCVPKS